MIRAAISGAFALLLAWSVLAVADGMDSGDYIKVEILGKLESGIMAIGGETTGVMIIAHDVAWELDLGGDATLQDAASRLNGKAVLVAGVYRRVAGTEILRRKIVTVTTLEAAE